MKKIEFWSTVGEFGFMSNFAPYPIKINGRKYKTTEHYFQSRKFVGTDPDYENEVANAPTAKIAASMGRDKSKPIRKDWESVKDNVMRIAVRTKMEQHPELAKLLLATEDSEIVEASPYDSYWGYGSDKKGLNKLGKILMEIREELKKAN